MSKNKLKFNEDFVSALNKYTVLITNNWPWKLLSLFLAICLWSGLITSDENLTREKIFTDVPVKAQNADTLRRNGFIVVSGLDNLPCVKMHVDVPQRAYNSVSATNYNPRIDLSKISSTGLQTLPIISSSTSAYGTVTELSVEEVTLQVEEYVSRSRIPVRLNISGVSPEGFYAGEASVDPSYVTVSGPASLVSKVVRCVADYNLAVLSAVSGLERTAVPFRLVDAVGNTIDSSLIEVTSESVYLDSMIVEQTLYASKELVINTTDLVNGVPADGYVIKRISAEPSMLVVAGSDQLIESLNELHLIEYIEHAIDVDGVNATMHRNIRLERTADIAYLSSDTILLTVEIAKQ